MIIEKTNIEGAYLLHNSSFKDDRGYFLRLFCNNELKKNGLDFEIKQSNLNFSIKEGTLKGMHYQKFPYPEIKLLDV